MRQRLGKKKVRKYAKLLGLDLVGGLVRGGTHHRVDLLVKGGKVLHYWPDGTQEYSADLSHSEE